MFKKLKWWERILGILTIIISILLVLVFGGVIPVNNEIVRWFIAIIMFSPAAYLIIGGTSMLIKSIVEGYKAETSPMSKGIFICSLVSLIIGFHELYYYFRGSKLGLITTLLSFIIYYICSYLLVQK